jgi:micrococcal nuclease|tara:strand:+ start:4411 stop:4812 length:402 start_codon:yes stop_codon:yes gene_type:complete
MYEYSCKVVKIVDGDTIDVDIDLGFGVWLKKQRIRLFGIDTPESRTRDLEEKKYGLAAKEYLTKWLTSGGVKIRTQKDAKGKFGRILGEMYCYDTNVNEKMIEEYHAVRYHGQSKKEIEEEHLLNRTKLGEMI